MDSAIIAALSALCGAVVGSVASFSGIWLAQRQENRRMLRRELFAAAIKLWERRMEYGATVGEKVLPVEDYIIDFLFFERFIDRLGHMSTDDLVAELEERDKRFIAIKKYRFEEMRKSSNH